MHPEPPAHDVSRDPILDGRDSLRLVKLRLALTAAYEGYARL